MGHTCLLLRFRAARSSSLYFSKYILNCSSSFSFNILLYSSRICCSLIETALETISLTSFHEKTFSFEQWERKGFCEGGENVNGAWFFGQDSCTEDRFRIFLGSKDSSSPEQIRNHLITFTNGSPSCCGQHSSSNWTLALVKSRANRSKSVLFAFLLGNQDAECDSADIVQPALLVRWPATQKNASEQQWTWFLRSTRATVTHSFKGNNKQ